MAMIAYSTQSKALEVAGDIQFGETLGPFTG
jgi:hypothetical protein